MSQLQINHSNDLKRLRDEGYQIEIYGGQILVHHIPYVTSQKQIKYGVLVSDFNSSGNDVLPPRDHVMKFSGEFPCNKDGSKITALEHGQSSNTLGNGIILNFSFSNKPEGGFKNFYDKFLSYDRILSSPAKSLDESVTSTPFKPIKTFEDESVFNYYDTNSSRANIEFINEKLVNQKIAIVGLGGTGSYILDLVAKTCVKEIHLFDGDVLLNHNAFRSPGAVSIETLERKPFKVNYYADLYGHLRKGIVASPIFIDELNIDRLRGYDYVFLCIDDNLIRGMCATFLAKHNQSFIDVGLGVNIIDGSLIGSLRVTSSSPRYDNRPLSLIPSSEQGNNEYSSNIQIAELNALNATLAVLKWKKLSGFYQDLLDGYNLSYSVNDSNLVEDEDAA
ncbi:MAG: molybdopterin/thiamine biosynthesis adenylyltransferase [Cyclobacteriaceae bacterium]|jgi:molybdopterin/thiamine biosynthesis adenylyltransferase